MAFRSPPPHRKGRGNLGTKLTKGGKPNKYTPHQGKKETTRRRESHESRQAKMMLDYFSPVRGGYR